MKETYIRTRTALVQCPECKGTGQTEQKAYHNQYEPGPCQKCYGHKKITINRVDNFTNELNILRSQLKKLKKENKKLKERQFK
jgi:DnaJ-class molecular chaperone